MSRNGLLSVEEFLIPQRVLDLTVQNLSDVGVHEREAFVVWGGVESKDGKRVSFHVVYRPVQKSVATEEGLLVVVDGEALFRMNKAFYERGMVAAAQVHTHPADAYHSDLDDSLPLMTLVGGLSAVIPHFAQREATEIGQWAWYRLLSEREWAPLGNSAHLVVSD